MFAHTRNDNTFNRIVLKGNMSVGSNFETALFANLTIDFLHIPTKMMLGKNTQAQVSRIQSQTGFQVFGYTIF